MSKHLQRFVDNFMKGAALGSTIADRWEKAADRRDAREIAREKNRIDAARWEATNKINERRTAAYERDIAAKAAGQGYYNRQKGSAGAGGPSPGAQQFIDTMGNAGIDVTGITPRTPAASTEPPEIPDSQPPDMVSPPSDGGTTPDTYARGGRVRGQAIMTGVMGQGTNALNAYTRSYDRNYDRAVRGGGGAPTPGAGTTGPGSGYGDTPAPPPSYQPGAIQTSPLPDLQDSGVAYRRGGRVRRFDQGGRVDDVGSEQAQADAKTRAYGRDQYERTWEGFSPQVRQQEERGRVPNFQGERPVNVRRYAEGGPVQGDIVIGADGYPVPQDPLWGPGGDWAREGAIEQIRQRRLARNTTSQPGSEDQTAPPAPPREPGRDNSDIRFKLDDREAAYRWAEGREPPRTIAQQQRRPQASSFVGEEARADESGRRGPGGAAAATEPDVPPQEGRGPGGAAAATEPDVPPQGAPKRGNGAISTGTPQRLLLGDQRRTAAYDPEADRMDPRNIGVVEPGGAVNERVYRAAAGTPRGDNAGMMGERLDRPGPQNTAARPEDYRASAVDYANRSSGGTTQGQASLYHGKDAPSPESIAQVMKVVDPDNTMTVGQRMQASAQAVHDWYVQQGDPEGAKRAAFEVTQFGVAQSRSHGVNAAKQAQAGDMKGAVASLLQGYEWLPNGKHASVQGGQIVITGQDGRAEMAIPINPQTITNVAMGMATGKLGWDVMQHSAGAQAAPPAPQAVSPTAPSRPAAQPSAAPAGPARTPAAPATAAAAPSSAAGPGASSAPPSPPAAAPAAAGAASRPATETASQAQGSQDGGSGGQQGEQGDQNDPVAQLQARRAAMEKQYFAERQKIMALGAKTLGKGERVYLTQALQAHKARYDKAVDELKAREKEYVQTQQKERQEQRQDLKPRDVTISDSIHFSPDAYKPQIDRIQKDPNLVKNTVLENLKTEQDRRPVYDLAQQIWTQNRHLSPEQAMNYALGVTSISPTSKGFNDKEGRDALQFKVGKSNARGGWSIELQNGETLNVDRSTIINAGELHRKNWIAYEQAKAKKDKEAEEDSKRSSLGRRIKAVTEAIRVVPPGGGPLPIRLPKMF